MKKLIAYLLLTTSSAWAGLPPTTARPQTGSSSVMFQTQAPFNQITKTSGTAGLVETGNTNIIGNPGFEATTGTSLWTASGGTFTTTTTTADVGSGLKAGSWDSNSASQTLTSTAVAIPSGDYGANYEVSANLKCASGTCTHLLQAFDGTNVIASQAITSSLTYARSALNFVAPTSGNISARIVSVASDEPTIYIDDVYLGRARNVGTVAQAELVGTVKITGCSGGWTGTSASYANFSTQTGCSYSVSGSLEAPATNIPAVRLRNRPPGKYVFSYTGNSSVGSSSTECFFRASDGTNVSLEENASFAGGSSLTLNFLDFSIEYGQAISDSTIQIQQRRSSGSGNCQVYGTTANPGVIKVYRYPLSSEIAYRSEQMQVAYSGRLNATSGWASGSGTSAGVYADFTTGSGISLTEEINLNFGTVTAMSGSLPGITFTPKQANNVYEACFQYVAYAQSNGNTGGIAITDGSNNILSATDMWTIATTAWSTTRTQCFLFRPTTISPYTLKLRYSSVLSNAFLLSTPSWGRDIISFTIKNLSQSLPAPNLVGSVTSLNTGSLRYEAGEINCDASSSVTNGSWWISSVGNRSSGSCTLTLQSGVFGSAPISCSITIKGSTVQSTSVSIISATSITFTGPNADWDGYITCLGQRGSL